MRNMELNLMLAGFMLCAGASPSLAQDKAREEGKLEATARELDKRYSEGQARVADTLKAQFGVDDSRVVSLRYRKLRYGEIAIALSLAQQMHGGITDKNLHKVVALRQGPPAAGWGKVAAELGLKLGPVLSRIKTISAEVSKREKADKKDEILKAEKRENKVRAEKTEKEGMKSLSRK